MSTAGESHSTRAIAVNASEVVGRSQIASGEMSMTAPGDDVDECHLMRLTPNRDVGAKPLSATRGVYALLSLLLAATTYVRMQPECSTNAAR